MKLGIRVMGSRSGRKGQGNNRKGQEDSGKREGTWAPRGGQEGHRGISVKEWSRGKDKEGGKKRGENMLKKKKGKGK